MEDQDRIGARIAALRKLRGMTGRRLAAEAHVSYSLLTKVEGGHVPASAMFVGAVARALRVDVPRITGQPYQPPGLDRTHDAIIDIRRSLLTHDIPPEPDTPPRGLGELRKAVQRVSELRRRTRFTHLSAELPGLLDELTYTVHAEPSERRQDSFALLADAYYAAECLGSGLGYQDVYLLSVERLAWAAEHSGDPVRVAAARWGRAGPLMRNGALRQGLRMLEAARDELEMVGRPALSVAGSLHLRSSLLAARAGDAETAWAHITEARRLADRVGATNHYELGFTPTNVTVHATSAAVEAGDGARAIEVGETREPLLGDAERIGHHYLDLARAYLMQGDPHVALQTLQRARRAAPQQIRHHPMTREIIFAIARRIRRTEELSRFAAWLGIDP